MKITNGENSISENLLHDLQQRSDKAAKARRKKGDKNSVYGYEITWWGYMTEFWPGASQAEWNNKHKAVAKHVSQRFRQGFDHKEFFYIVVRHWDDIMVARFGWMKESPPPKHPEIGFVWAQLDRFVEVYHDYVDQGVITGVKQGKAKDADETALDRMQVANKKLVAKLETQTDELNKFRKRLKRSQLKLRRGKRIEKDIDKLRIK